MRLERALEGAGLRRGRPADADVVIVNTCGFIDGAKEESVGAILDAAEAAHARGARVAAVGCLVERYRADLEAELPEVDLWGGLEWGPLVTALGADARAPANAGAGAQRAARAGAGPVAEARRSRPTHAYVKISDGCDRRCAYCAISLIKGAYAAVAPEEVLREAALAVAAGARELVLVGQDTSRWAWPGWGGLPRLLAELEALGPVWIRLLYLQPDGVDGALLEALAVPARLAGWIVGRPDEVNIVLDDLNGVTGAELHDQLVEFIAAAGLAVAGVFAFDAQEGTAAASLPRQVPVPLALERAARVSAAIDAAAARFWEDLVGREADVLVERGSGRPDGEALGRLAVQAPDVDGRTLLTGRPLRRGQLVRARVVAALGYDVAAATAG